MDYKKLIASFTDEQLAEYIRGVGNWNLFSNETMGIKKIKLSDGPHGMRTEPDGKRGATEFFAKAYKAICYPSLSLTSCSFNRNLIHELGATMADEAKHLGVHVILGPAVNIKRDPLCGRNFEYISEDPFVVGELATSYINGVQENGIGTSIKHFACNNCETDRMVINSVVDERALREIYLFGFEKAVKNSKPYTIMAAYNKLNGHYATANHHLLTEILRDEWKYDGVVMSDWCAVDNICDAVVAGLDLEMPESGKVQYKVGLEGIKNDHKVKEAFQNAIERQLKLIDKSLDLNPDFVFDYESHHALAKRIADESIILLKNEDSILPLNKDEKVLFIGTLADQPRYQGGGSSNINPFKVTKMSELIKDNPNIEIIKGYEINEDKDNEDLLNEVKEKAKTADKVVCFLGFNHIQESEGFDKKNIKLYNNQLNLIKTLQDVNKNIIVVLENGSVVELPFVDDVKAIVEAYLGGEAINESIYDILYGNVNPSGRLNETFAKNYEDYPSLNNFPGDKVNTYYKESIYVGYRYFDTFKKQVVFPFGYGLSYTTFEYSNLSIQTSENSVKVKLNITNTGYKKGKEVVQVYIKNAAKPQYFIENKALKAFEKIELNPGETKEIEFNIPYEDLRIFDIKSNKFQLLKGNYTLYVSKHSLDENLYANFTINNGVEDVFDYRNISNLLNGEIDKISNEEFAELFVDKKLPIAHRDLSKCDINSSFEDAIQKGSKGAKLAIKFLSSLGMLKKDPTLLGFMKTASMRQLHMGSNGKLTRKNMNVFIDLLNDKHRYFNFIRMLFLLAKMA